MDLSLSFSRKAQWLALALIASIAAFTLGPISGFASSHREAPLISQDPAADATDLYAFLSPADSKKLVLVGTHYPLGIRARVPTTSASATA